MEKSLDVEGVKYLLQAAADAVLAEVEMLTHADQVIGDGDHGIGMSRGCLGLKEVLAGETVSIPETLAAAGRAFMLKVGGSSGAIFGTMFLAGSKVVPEGPFDAKALADFLEAGLEGVQKRGNAKTGDKTMVDALAPAARAAREHADASLDECLRAAADAAWRGMEATKDMTAALGRARTLGDRVLGHPDPGAISMALLLRGMASSSALNQQPG